MTEKLTECWNRFSLTEEEKEEIVITGNNVKETMERGKLCLVGKIIADMKINKEAFKNTMFKI